MGMHHQRPGVAAKPDRDMGEAVTSPMSRQDSVPRPRSIGTPAESLAVSPELEWLLVQAFGEAMRLGRPAVDGGTAVTTAGRLGLLPRIVHRLGPAQLAKNLGPDAAEDALESYRASALSSAKLVSLARLVGRVAADNGIRVVALKHVALCLAGICSPGERGAADADVLVSDADAPRLTDALVHAGITKSDAPGYDHQHSPLYHPKAGMLELHRTVPGV